MYFLPPGKPCHLPGRDKIPPGKSIQAPGIEKKAPGSQVISQEICDSYPGKNFIWQERILNPLAEYCLVTKNRTVPCAP